MSRLRSCGSAHPDSSRWKLSRQLCEALAGCGKMGAN